MFFSMYVTKKGTVKYCGAADEVISTLIYDNDRKNGYIPKEIPNLTNVKQIFYNSYLNSFNRNSTLFFLLNDGTVKCAGTNANYELGLGDCNPRTSITNVPISNVKDIALGYKCTFFLLNDGTVKACGINLDNAMSPANVNCGFPQIITIPVSNVRKVRADQATGSVFFLLNDNRVLCSGTNDKYQLGFNDNVKKCFNYLPNNQYTNVSQIKDIIICNKKTFFLYYNGDVKYFGYIEDYNEGAYIARKEKPIYNAVILKDILYINNDYDNNYLVTKDNIILCNGQGREYSLDGPKSVGFGTLDVRNLRKNKKPLNITSNGEAVFIILDDYSIMVGGKSLCGQLGLPEDKDESGSGVSLQFSPLNDVRRFYNMDIIQYNSFLIKKKSSDTLYNINFNNKSLDPVSNTKNLNFNVSNFSLENCSKKYIINNTVKSLLSSINEPFKIYKQKTDV